MEVYLDNSATTRCSEQVADLMMKVLTVDFGNPSSMHQKGVDAENYVKKATQMIAKSMRVSEKEILYTSGGTESNNLAIIGTALANQRRGKHLITTAIEHPSVKNPMQYLEQQGFEVTYLPVDQTGRIRLDVLEESVREDTVLVSVMHVNNEIGAVQPLEEIGRVIRQKNSETFFHVDSVQGFGKFRVFPKRIGIDFLSVSGHKIHGPKGVGILYMSERTKVQPILFGGGQQKNIRSGTENVPGIAGIGQAVKEAYEHFEENTERMYRLRRQLIEALQKMEGVTLNGPLDETGAPHIVSANFDGIGSEVLLHTLEENQIYVSAGSACSSHKKTASDTLQAIGLGKKNMEGTIRFSLSVETTEEEIEYCIEVINSVLTRLRRYHRH